MKRFLFFAGLSLLASLNLQATEALLFDGGGYNMQIMVGYEDNPVVAQVLFTPPAPKSGLSFLAKVFRFKIRYEEANFDDAVFK